MRLPRPVSDLPDSPPRKRNPSASTPEIVAKICMQFSMPLPKLPLHACLCLYFPRKIAILLPTDHLAALILHQTTVSKPEIITIFYTRVACKFHYAPLLQTISLAMQPLLLCSSSPTKFWPAFSNTLIPGLLFHSQIHLSNYARPRFLY